ncbi:SpoIIE family protein phosphatase [Nocardioides sp. MAHUQ-72]|uniref:SpoIIE family protein phosphatase n=1 Tax=unclassified Nocardioides TaxID=2615069 RepID=UPI0036244AB2
MVSTSGSQHTPAYGPVDLASCEDEPIHVPGAIQPHGVLLAVDPTSLEVAVASANCEQQTGVLLADAVGSPLAAFIGEDAAEQVRRRTIEQTFREPLIVRLPASVRGDLGGREVDISLHLSGSRLVVELETLGRPRSVMLSYQSARGAMARLAEETTVLGLAAQLAREVAALTLFDRVMVYRFDRDWNGEVIAEERRADLNPFLGLHYPATDIPAQARRLYTVNWTRLIADVDYVPVPLVPVLDPASAAPLDLSHSTLRSVSPIHLEYLHNMGVTSSMSISLVIDGELWGLIACHHYSGPHRPSQDARAAAEFLGQVASQQVAERQRSDAREEVLRTRSMLSRIVGRVAATSGSTLEALLDDPELLELMGADGVALSYDGTLRTVGEVPPLEALPVVAHALLGPEDGSVGHTDRLGELDARLAAYDGPAAGALAIGTLPDRWIVWFRPELQQTVDWGGDPHNKEVAAAEDTSVRLSPRKSFEKWREVVRGRSRPWVEEDEEAAHDLRSRINGLLLKRSRDQIEVAESLQRSVLADGAPRLEGLEVAVRYASAASYQLGGDWWDCMELDGDRVAFVIGDVAGHGVSAVAAMTQVRAALRAYLFAGHDTGQSLDQLDLFMSALLGEQIASAQIVVVDRAARRLEVASAGHPPPLLLPPDPAAPLHPVARPVLGLGAGTAVVTSVDVPAGTTLLMFTDGLVERRGTDLFDSLDLLSRTAGDGPGGQDLDLWVDQVLADMPAQGDDDTTVLALTVL